MHKAKSVKSRGRARSASIFSVRGGSATPSGAVAAAAQMASIVKRNQAALAEQRAAADELLQKEVERIMALPEENVISESEKCYVSQISCLQFKKALVFL